MSRRVVLRRPDGRVMYENSWLVRHRPIFVFYSLRAKVLRRWMKSSHAPVA